MTLYRRWWMMAKIQHCISAVHLKWKWMSGIQNVLCMNVFIKYFFDSYRFSCKICHYWKKELDLTRHLPKGSIL